jgi:drug/metabolite transporter (DMT)-like permease
MAAITYALLTVLSSAAFTLVLRGAMQVWPIGVAGVLSRCVTLPLLGGWILTRGEGWRRLRPGAMLRSLMLMGAISILVNLLWFGSLKLTTATNATMLMRIDLVFVVFLGTLLGLERITPGELALVPVFLAGMALLTGVADSGWSAHLLGDLMAVGATFFYAVNAFQIRTILREMDEEAVAFYNHGLSTLGFVTMAIACDEFSTALPAVSMASAWWWIVGVGVTAAVSLPLYYAALRRLPVWKLRAWLLLSPVLVAIVEWLWGVRLSLSQWLGAAMVLGGLAALIRMEWRAAVRPIAPPRTAGGECPVEALDGHRDLKVTCKTNLSPQRTAPCGT